MFLTRQIQVLVNTCGSMHHICHDGLKHNLLHNWIPESYLHSTGASMCFCHSLRDKICLL